MPYTIVNSYLSCNSVAVALICKSGNSSIREVSEEWYVGNYEAKDWPLRLAFIREPFDRFCSAYSFFSQCYWKNTGYCRETEEAAAKSYYEFVNFALTHTDEHWDEQGKSLLFNGEYTPTHTIKLDKINEIWPLFATKSLKIINTSVRLPVCPKYRREELNKMFGGDIELYNSALESFNG